MSDPFIGEIKAFPYNFTPMYWASCNGQTMNINQNQALFALIGNKYGGNYPTTFCLPNLNGKIPVGMGNGTNLTPRIIASTGGTAQESLTIAQIPIHSHLVNAVNCDGIATQPKGNFFAISNIPDDFDAIQNPIYNNAQPIAGGNMNSAILSSTGNSQPHENRQPYLVMNWCIATMGIFPTRE